MKGTIMLNFIKRFFNKKDWLNEALENPFSV